MAKPLNERLASARSTDRVTITDLEALIAEAIVERDRQIGASEHHAAEAVNLALSDDDREDADRAASHCKRTAKAYTTAIDELQDKLEAKRNAESRKAAEAEQAARIARRDDLAARLADRVPKLFAELISLFTEIEAIPDAEAIARRVPGNFYDGVSPITRLTSMKIPNWNGSGIAWPIDRQSAVLARVMESERRQRIDHEKAMAAEAARWSRYMVEPPKDGTRTFIETRRGMMPIGVTGYSDTPVEAVMTVEGVKDAEANGCTVTALKDNESLGLPPDVAVLA